MKKLSGALLAAIAPIAASAEPPQCRVPDVLPTPEIAGPSRAEPRRRLPVTHYVLALSWSPEHCRFRKEDASERLQCGPDAPRFGFTLHGLWPDSGATWPQYCRAAPALSKAVLQRHFCMTPSVQLLQHEWVKHGTCVATDPARYFRAAATMYRAVRFPNMTALSRSRLTVGRFAEAFAAANRGVTPDMIEVRRNRRGWLTEVWLCLARDLRPRACPEPMDAATKRLPLSIWRG